MLNLDKMQLGSRKKWTPNSQRFLHSLIVMVLPAGMALCSSEVLFSQPALAASCRERPGDADLYNSNLVPSLFKKEHPSLPFYRGSAPTQAGLERLKQLGVTTIIDLRKGEAEGNRVKGRVVQNCNLTAPHLPMSPTEEAGVVRKLGLKYISLPMYRAPSKEQMATFLAITNDPKIAKSMYVHCQHGRDRTGGMVALYRLQHDRWDFEKTLAEMRGYGFDPSAQPEITHLLRTQAR
jgi:Tyrosine phosphatase family